MRKNILSGFLLMVVMVSTAQAAEGWSAFKARFMSTEGRIIDSGNNNVSHTEGQGYGMLMAVAWNDRASFSLLWNWTQKNLKNNDNGLFYWRYVPNATPPVSDKNNASDGDVLIAWALQKAGEKWHVDAWLQASDAIQRAIIAQNVTRFAGYTVMLPAARGFNKNSYMVLNPSYFLFSAWRDFARRSHLGVWNTLIADGMTLLEKMRFGDAGLPVDWVALNADGSVAPASGWPPRFSYDAVRIPLNLYAYDASSLRLVPFQHFWMQFPRQQTPAWIDVLNNNKSPYNMNAGLLAVRDLTLGDNGQLSGVLSEGQDYYTSSLQLLVLMTQRGL
ncbi:endoglucanase [Erwinia sp. OLTSP20]|uniref:glycosyl hydrolase family 8 n=1 Tax=unclassified Erwinia TaxID=2622719 RepID=UPI000C1A26DD|nr:MULTISPECIES: glycosyl hydrolase family 8 [unclassified Erwinia]PIJ50741.1 endoglucanase [Erwinia sp. OAMSP11]PIJ75410.1 endoglucanase [Erwinia sp. OLSSP12]PIJ81908.1 endoglucanase [Erwinia sp. OLCASP19]PIJ84563.1 endoglucanase [Erwinia sp. OLMTSP26]PIJ86910.1 endoglucanase [Erwinia sp. OLMDSP33]